MRDNPTFGSFKGQVSKHYDKIFTGLGTGRASKYGYFSRETYNALKYELLHMPSQEVNTLPLDLQVWVSGLERKSEQVPSDKKDLESHNKDLSKTAKILSKQLRSIKRYAPLSNDLIGDLAVDCDEPDFLEFLEPPLQDTSYLIRKPSCLNCIISRRGLI